jgi:hypothetical protein
MTGILAAIAGSGLGALETQTLTVGTSGSFVYGYDAANFGSISPGTSTIYSGSSWVALYHSDFDGSTILELNAVVANSGWTTMNINGAVFNRADAVFFAGGGISRWDWTGAGFGRTPSPTIVTFR